MTGIIEVQRIFQDALPKIRVPQPGDRVYKDECVYSFDTPESETGLYVCLKTFWGLGKDFVDKYVSRTGNSVFLHIKRIKHKIEKPQIDGPERKVTRLAIGVDGGFDTMDHQFEYDIEEHHSIVLFPGHHVIPLSDPSLPEQLTNSVSGVLAAESATRLAELEQMSATWDGEVRAVSKHCQNLQQLDNGRKVPPRGWKCEAEGCTKTDNLWMNLTDGSIFCGRKNFDGSGGNNHAVEHYNETKYPLAVKLGTITPDGKADVFSYEEDDMVIDSYLTQHLAHFGINASQMEKTEKTMAEMEIDLNSRIHAESMALTEGGKNLEPSCGPGLTGLVNIGSSCYLNSVMQMVFTIPAFQSRFLNNAYKYFEASSDPVNDFNVQMSKLCNGLLSGKYAIKGDDGEINSDSQVGISPHMFRHLIGRGHSEFSSKKQQDAQEFFLHLINVLERHSVNERNPADCFKFQVEDKVVCDRSGFVRYSQRTEYSVPLQIPLEAAINKAEVKAFEAKKAEAKANKVILTSDQTVRPKIPFEACLEAFIAKETLDPFLSTATKQVGTASKFTRLATFPDYLVIQLKKFCLGEDWTPQKLDVSVDMPFELDISALRAKGKQPEEVELPEAEAAYTAPAVDETVVNQLMEMGFQRNACTRAVIATGNSGAETAMNWIMEHMGDSDINDPIPCALGGSNTIGSSFVPNEDAMASIEAMGFTRDQAKKALKNTDNNVERALDWIFSHPDELNTPDNANDSKVQSSISDGSGQYKLMGFISHIGTSSLVGHYVCHILKDGCWTLFNDNRVAKSENLPKDLGYLYFYKRV